MRPVNSGQQFVVTLARVIGAHLEGRAPAAALRQGRLSVENYHRQCHGGCGVGESPQVLDMKELAGARRISPGSFAAWPASRFFNTGQTFAPLQGD
jgi:hypothetical protein